MRRSVIVAGAVLLAACGTKAPPPPPAAPPPPPPAPAPVNLADVAGKWTMQVMPADKDTTVLTFTLDAKADTAGWTMTFPTGKPVPTRVMASGDSLIMDAGPYPSALRPGMTVTTHGSVHLSGGKLMGATTAHYKTAGADSVRTLRTQGTKVP